MLSMSVFRHALREYNIHKKLDHIVSPVYTYTWSCDCLMTPPPLLPLACRTAVWCLWNWLQLVRELIIHHCTPNTYHYCISYALCLPMLLASAQYLNLLMDMTWTFYWNKTTLFQRKRCSFLSPHCLRNATLYVFLFFLYFCCRLNWSLYKLCQPWNTWILSGLQLFTLTSSQVHS